MAKPKPKPDDREQSKRFVEKAQELEEGDSEKKFEDVFKKIIPPKPKRSSNSTSSHRTDEAQQ